MWKIGTGVLLYHTEYKASRLWACIIKLSLRGVKVKTFLRVVGALLVLGGIVFFLQGISILPGSYMTGDRQWAINGGVMTIIGIALMFWTKYVK